MISQLASTKTVKKTFSHSLDNINGGGIFAVGEVVQPKLKTTPLIPKEPHYSITLKSIDVGGDIVDLPKDYFGGASAGGTIIDSGTTLAYLPDDVYVPLMKKVLARQPNVQTHSVQSQFRCFFYTGNIDDGFPVVKVHFEDSLTLTIYPRDYLFDLDVNGASVFKRRGWKQVTVERLLFLEGRYHSNKIEAGTTIGAIGAQSIGEPETQVTLKSFHFAGIASMNVTLGVPRIKEIINAAKKVSTPIISAKLINGDNPKEGRVAKALIEKTLLGQVAKSIRTVMTARKASVVITLIWI